MHSDSECIWGKLLVISGKRVLHGKGETEARPRFVGFRLAVGADRALT